jgi:hypothetical protein
MRWRRPEARTRPMVNRCGALSSRSLDSKWVPSIARWVGYAADRYCRRGVYHTVLHTPRPWEIHRWAPQIMAYRNVPPHTHIHVHARAHTPSASRLHCLDRMAGASSVTMTAETQLDKARMPHRTRCMLQTNILPSLDCAGGSKRPRL